MYNNDFQNIPENSRGSSNRLIQHLIPHHQVGFRVPRLSMRKRQAKESDPTHQTMKGTHDI